MYIGSDTDGLVFEAGCMPLVTGTLDMRVCWCLCDMVC